jgi:hypothetical protein
MSAFHWRMNLVLGNAKPAGAFLGFEEAAPGERCAAQGLVAGIAVGDGEELHPVAGEGEFGASAAELLLAVVGMGADGDDAQFWALCGGHKPAQERGCGQGGEEKRRAFHAP